MSASKNFCLFDGKMTHEYQNVWYSGIKQENRYITVDFCICVE